MGGAATVLNDNRVPPVYTPYTGRPIQAALGLLHSAIGRRAIEYLVSTLEYLVSTVPLSTLQVLIVPALDNSTVA